jgi:hypothetical protein
MRGLILLAAAAAAAFGQAQSNVVSITASRQLSVQPDQVTVNISVITNAGQSVDAALALLQGTNITAADLTTVSTVSGATQVQWSFSRVVSIPDMTALLAALKLSDNIFLYVSGTSTSPAAAAAQQCPYPALINDARQQAAKLASAAGVAVGQIVSISQPSVPAGIAAPYLVRSGDFTALGGTFSVINPLLGMLPAGGLYTSPSSCSLTVQFKLGQ